MVVAVLDLPRILRTDLAAVGPTHTATATPTIRTHGCPGHRHGAAAVSINDLIASVNGARQGCPR